MSLFARSMATARQYAAVQGGQFAVGAAQGAAGYGHLQTGQPTAAGGLGALTGETLRTRYDHRQAMHSAAYNARAMHATRTVSTPASAVVRTRALGTNRFAAARAQAMADLASRS